MPQPERACGSRIAPAAVAADLDAMAPREVRILAGLDVATLADLLAAAAPTRRPVLRLAALAARQPGTSRAPGVCR